MGYRNEDGTWHDNCLEKIKPGEPIFVLRGQDILAPGFIRGWAVHARSHGLCAEKVCEALDCADAMDNWPSRKYPD